jgi:small basic protein (TIGR04137 family)
LWLAGGGVKGGHVHGATDDFGCNIAKDAVHIHDMQATLLHLFGIDHEGLLFRYPGPPIPPDRRPWACGEGHPGAGLRGKRGGESAKVGILTAFPLAPAPSTPFVQSSTHLTAMTQHNSFKSSASSSGAKRNVLKRFERVELLKKRGAVKDLKRVTKLPKTKPDA